MIRRFLLLALMLAAFSFVALPGQALAKDLFKGPESSPLCDSSRGSDTSAVCTGKTSDNPLTGNDGILIKIANVIAFIAGGAAVIVVLVGSIRYITSGGDSGKVSSAKSTVINAAIGLVIIVFARILIVYIIKKL